MGSNEVTFKNLVWVTFHETGWLVGDGCLLTFSLCLLFFLMRIWVIDRDPWNCFFYNPKKTVLQRKLANFAPSSRGFQGSESHPLRQPSEMGKLVSWKILKWFDGLHTQKLIWKTTILWEWKLFRGYVLDFRGLTTMRKKWMLKE